MLKKIFFACLLSSFLLGGWFCTIFRPHPRPINWGIRDSSITDSIPNNIDSLDLEKLGVWEDQQLGN
jgi:hypothetical protein